MADAAQVPGRVLAAIRSLVLALLEAAGFALGVAALVWLLPGKLPVFVFSLYGLICVWLLQAAAAVILLVMLARGLVNPALRAAAAHAVVLCGGFVAAIALCNAYIQMLAHAWSRNLAVAVDHIPIDRLIGTDAHIFAALAPGGTLLAHLAAWYTPYRPAALDGTILGLPLNILAFGAFAGLVVVLWTRLAKGRA